MRSHVRPHMKTTGRILTRLLLSAVIAASILPIAIFTVPGVRENPVTGAAVMAGLVAGSFLLFARFGPRPPR